MVVPADRWVKKQVERARVATDEYKLGVANPDRDPIKAALDANAKRIAKLQDSIAKKTWETKMSKLTIEDWRTPASTKGADRFASGVESARPKIEKFVTSWQPKLAAIQAAVRALPEVTDADREKRMIENLRRLKAAKGTV
jgi:mevalonate kinase